MKKYKTGVLQISSDLYYSGVVCWKDNNNWKIIKLLSIIDTNVIKVIPIYKSLLGKRTEIFIDKNFLYTKACSIAKANGIEILFEGKTYYGQVQKIIMCPMKYVGVKNTLNALQKKYYKLLQENKCESDLIADGIEEEWINLYNEKF